ncbi:hypothetical protein PHYSODRAFT_326417 [Phytophthora sojae]|uniref:Uncharacterized protein n=1 Tax=Phytophthora sojae (strain P6497) TaxID=1094619 RepID=G4YSX8_PHYSP|nr:hypothetical protein PHYSODRAFT_326417 [Phytophthora sojae]EGZ25397.1 hypothetical protein PHYSODRAFT_326417 [Phytophthora sojae]|eukprot:XP_009520685.1 hypothetical protein PHYSODRAFT_326417 [Phytophthora sojae]
MELAKSSEKLELGGAGDSVRGRRVSDGGALVAGKPIGKRGAGALAGTPSATLLQQKPRLCWNVSNRPVDTMSAMESRLRRGAPMNYIARGVPELHEKRKIMAEASMYTDDKAADSSSTVGGSSSDDDERTNQQELTARGRSENQGSSAIKIPT